MKTNMNPDLEFLRGLRDRLILQRTKLEWEASNKSPFGSEASDEAVRCDLIAAEISVYLTSRGIE